MIDKDDFELWKESPVTRAVLAVLAEQAKEREEGRKELLYHAAGALSPADWAALQPNAAFVQGQNDMVDFLLNLQIADLQPEAEPSDEWKVEWKY